MASDPNTPDTGGVPAPDRHQIERLNVLWEIIDAAPVGGGLRSRLAGGARRLFGRILSKQQEFNAALVDHLNRNMPVLDEMSRATERMEAVADDLHRHREALLARERRSDAAVAALVASHDELRATVSVLQQSVQQLKRELARAQQAPAVVPAAAPVETASAAPTTAPTTSTQFQALDSHKYVGFEDHFRGDRTEIAARQADYVRMFAGAHDVLDVGCGRGEFLEALRAAGVGARGIDLNPSMIDVCTSKGLDATAIDALSYLRAQADGSLGGLFAAQVVEHLEPSYLVQLLDVAYDKLRPGSLIVLETINPACWLAFFESYIRDITHVRPIHPDTLKYLLVASGFQRVNVEYRAPYPESDKLQPVAAVAVGDSAAARDFVETLNANVTKLNGLMFTHLDYAAIGYRS